MTEMLFRQDAYLRSADGLVTAHTPEGGIVVDASVFYPTGGGQPGDSGMIAWDGQDLSIATTVKGEGDAIVLVPAEAKALPPVGARIQQELNWERRHKHMRVHTALHLLSVVLPLPVTGGQISAGRGRLDFAMPEPPQNRDAVEHALRALVEDDLEVSETWVSDAVLDAMPELVKTMSVKPPRGTGHVRLVRIGRGTDQVDLQPCGGTHVARTGEIGSLQLGKIENKGRQNRRVHVLLET